MSAEQGGEIDEQRSVVEAKRDAAASSERGAGDCPECDEIGTVTLTSGLLPVCLSCDWTGWDVNP